MAAGRLIDRAALTALGAAGLYLLFLNAGAGIVPAGAMAFVGTALARALLRRSPRPCRATRAQAEAAVMAVAMLPEPEGALRELAGCADAVCVIRHPSCALTAGDVFALWRENRASARLTVAATCPADDGARSVAAALGVTIIDSRALIRTIRLTGRYAPPEVPRTPMSARLRRAVAAAMDRPASPRAALYGASLLGMYLITGTAAYLFAAMAALFATGARLIRRLA